MPGEFCVRNRQRTRSIDLPIFRSLARYLLDVIFRLEEYELGVQLVGSEEMARVNEQFLGHTGSTDVITFDYQSPATFQPSTKPRPLHGEVFISIPDAVKQAREFKTTWQSELARYLIHGLLHLQGYDDLEARARLKMKRQESRLLKAAGKKFVLAHLKKSTPRARRRTS